MHCLPPSGLDHMKTLRARLSVTAFAGAIGLSLASMPGRSEPVYPWCAVSSSAGLGQPLCHFATLEQCNAFLMGLNGSCRPNPQAATGGRTPGKGQKS
jgi:hypothetical protein